MYFISDFQKDTGNTILLRHCLLTYMQMFSVKGRVLTCTNVLQKYNIQIFRTCSLLTQICTDEQLPLSNTRIQTAKHNDPTVYGCMYWFSKHLLELYQHHTHMQCSSAVLRLLYLEVANNLHFLRPTEKARCVPQTLLHTRAQDKNTDSDVSETKGKGTTKKENKNWARSN